MALKTAVITISAKGRDQGKVYHITEKDSAQVEDFALRIFFAALNAGAEIPADIVQAGMAGLLQMGFKALTLVPYEAMRPLLAEMMTCVMYQPDPARRDIVRPLEAVGDIEEVSTRLTLRKEIFNLHCGFFIDAAQSNSAT